jgi:hypothetical protein
VVIASVAPTTASQTEPADVVNLASGTGIRAVSGELQLSDNVNVLAETLGKLLNIARMDGEAADAYVNRLVANIQTLPADQKAMKHGSRPCDERCAKKHVPRLSLPNCLGSVAAVALKAQNVVLS